MLKHIRLLPFTAGIGVGLLLLFFYDIPKTIIYEYPHPHNINERVYRDKNGMCYEYTAQKVKCDANEGTLRQYPIQG